VPAPRRPAALRGRVFRASDVLDSGLLTRDALRSSAWRRLYRGVYADADLPDSHGLRVAGAAILVPRSAAFSGRTAAYLHGATQLADAETPVEVSVPTGVRFGPAAGLRVRQVGLPDPDVCTVQRHRCTGGLRTALDIARCEPLAEAVVALDVLLALVVVGRGELAEAAGAGHGSRRGVERMRRAVALSDGRAESPPESRLRVLLALAGLPAVPQHTVRDAAGDFVARVDLAYPDRRIAIEYDGAWHGEKGQLSKDRRRHNRLVAAGWTVLYVTAADMHDPEGLVNRIRGVLGTPTPGK
jgi:very-short-patch-repair endonuclease